MRCKTAYRRPRDATTQFHGSKNLFHAGDCRARKRFAVELNVEASILRIADTNRRSILARTTKNKFSEQITVAVAVGAATQESAGAVAKQATELARDAARSQRAAVNISGHDKNGLGLPGTYE